jgi:hypothetical protein
MEKYREILGKTLRKLWKNLRVSSKILVKS